MTVHFTFLVCITTNLAPSWLLVRWEFLLEWE